jgi:hypothetical protein
MTVLKKLLYGVILGLPLSAFSQEDLLSLVSDSTPERPKKIYATFKTVKIGNLQTIETVKKNHLDFRISHRFGNVYDATLKNPINETFQTFFGFGNVSDVRFSLDYGITDNLCIGIGRSTMNKLLDGNLKWKILQQTSDFSMPISLAFFTSMGYTHARPEEDAMYAGIVKDFTTNELHRFNYFHQLIIASKLNEYLSVELLPGYMYRNFIKERINSNNKAADENGFFTLGIGARIKITKRVSFIGDYLFNFSQFYGNNPGVKLPLSLGFEIETGGHVFSLFFTNARGLIENNFIPYTTDSWLEGQIKFGFTISRTFSL